jgi:hypothetical protein
LFIINSENVGEIRLYNGSTFVSVVETGIKSHPQFHDSIGNLGNLTVWLGYDGKIYAHGKISPFDKEGMFTLGQVQETLTSSGVRTGAILIGGNNTDGSPSGTNNKGYKSGLYLSYSDSAGADVVKVWDIYGTGASGDTGTVDQGDVFTLVKFFPTMSTVRYIDLYMYPVSGSGSTSVGTVKIYFNQSSTAWASKTITRDIASRGYLLIDVDKQYINSIQLEFEFNSSVQIGTNDLAPSVAVVDYEPTQARG